MTQFSVEWWAIFFAGVSTFAIYSFLYKENPFYRFFEHFFIGIATGYVVVATLSTFLWPQVLKPLLGLDLITFPDGTTDQPYDTRNLLWLVPMLFGLLYYCILTKRHKWLAELVIGTQLGYAGGLAFKGFFVEFMPQVFDSFKPLYDPRGLFQSLTNIVFILTLLSSLCYFFFTFRPKSYQNPRIRSVKSLWLPCGVLLGLGILAASLLVEGERPLITAFILPIIAAVVGIALTARRYRVGVSRWDIWRLSATAAVLLVVVSIAVGFNRTPYLMEEPEINLALTITVIVMLTYYLFSQADRKGGVVAASTGVGRWLMMGCFGAFFGSTIMARMALLVERLEFLIHQWFPLFG